ncbi:MAG TPA: hypothetical protein VH134_13320 [Candidatus Dormibacteraeota bacterium]|jgi:hypothetical protein|nr:hypothetical protein [Candidatus Dormibacteraeota bacterium]
MGWVGRLLGHPNGTVAVRLPADLAEALDNREGGRGLDDAVERVLRAHLAGGCRAVPDDTERMPFWLSRRDAPVGDIEGELRGRMAQRRAAEAEAESEDDSVPPRRPPSPRSRRPSRG